VYAVGIGTIFPSGTGLTSGLAQRVARDASRRHGAGRAAVLAVVERDDKCVGRIRDAGSQ